MNSEHATKLVVKSLNDSEEAIKTLDVTKIMEIAQVVVSCYKKGGKIMLCGNGGSASQAQHLAAELVCKFRLKRKALSALALTSDASILTAQANDNGFETVFERQVEAHGRKGDALICISTSGQSENVLRALLLAKKKGIITVAFVGNNRNSRIATVADHRLFVMSGDTPRVQEAHLAAGHVICDLVEKELATSFKA